MSNKTIKRIRRKFGFNKDRDGLITRYLAEKENWQNHITRTKNFILNSAKGKNKDLCLILGSGWWIDIPVDELHKMFKRVIFADISHPSQIRHKAKKYDRLELVDIDIAQVLSVLLSKDFKQHKLNPLSKIIQKKHLFGFDTSLKPDFVASVNILNQLSYFPKRYLMSLETYNEEEIDNFINCLEQSHLHNLPVGKSCIITDYFQFEYDKNGKFQAEMERLSISLPMNNSRKEWIWDFDLSGNFITGKKVKFKVAALQV